MYSTLTKQRQTETTMIRAILATTAFILVFGLVGNADLEEAKRQADHYTTMVCEGHWPDYDNRNPECN